MCVCNSGSAITYTKKIYRRQFSARNSGTAIKPFSIRSGFGILVRFAPRVHNGDNFNLSIISTMRVWSVVIRYNIILLSVCISLIFWEKCVQLLLASLCEEKSFMDTLSREAKNATQVKKSCGKVVIAYFIVSWKNIFFCPCGKKK